MGVVAIRRITNANVFMNGNTQLGKLEEFNLPDVEGLFSEHKALGMFGKLELPTGLDKMAADMKWNSLYDDAAKVYYNIFGAVQLQVRTSVEGYGGTGRNAQVPLVTTIVGQFRNLPFGKYKQHDNVELSSKFNIMAITQRYNGVELITIDVTANIYRVNGVDLLAQWKLNLGA